MNRPMSPASVSSGAAASPATGGVLQEHLSALVDGEIDAAAAAALWREDGGELCATWARYQLIGETLRGSSPRAADPQRVASVMQRVRQERATALPSVLPQRVEAANDAVFRWKMLAGFASLAAVLAVSWNMAGSVSGAGPQWAQAPAQEAPVVAAAEAPAQAVAPVAVPGQQGTVLRDPRLEELMAAHRQAGGMSALQMPAGFLRNAAFDLPEGSR